MKNVYFAELTDTFGGEANYSWASHFKISASTIRGAVVKLNKHLGGGYKKTMATGDMLRYDAGCTCYFIEDWDEDAHGQYSRVEEV